MFVNSESEVFLVPVRTYVCTHRGVPRIFSVLRQLCIHVRQHCQRAQCCIGNEINGEPC